MLLTKHRSEVKDFILMDYDEQKVMNAFYDDGRKEGIQALIEDNLEEGTSPERITEKLKTKFKLTQEQAENYLDKYSK